MGDARVYDFRTPEVLDRNRLRSLRLVIDNVVRLAGRSLSADLRTTVELTVTDVREMIWDELARSATDPACLVLFGLNPLPGRALFHVPVDLAMSVVELRLGGDGHAHQASRTLTDIDCELLADVLDDAVQQLVAAFGPVAELSAGTIQVEATAQLLQVVRASDSCLAIGLDIVIGDGRIRSAMQLAFPLTTLRPLMASLVHLSDGRGSDVQKDVIVERLQDVAVDVAVRFSPTLLSSGELLGLAVGDVIHLHHPQDRPLEVALEGVPYLAARMAQRGRRVACTVLDKAAL